MDLDAAVPIGAIDFEARIHRLTVLARFTRSRSTGFVVLRRQLRRLIKTARGHHGLSLDVAELMVGVVDIFTQRARAVVTASAR